MVGGTNERILAYLFIALVKKLIRPAGVPEPARQIKLIEAVLMNVSPRAGICHHFILIPTLNNFVGACLNVGMRHKDIPYF
jgi:hypothetical protein